MNIFDLPKLKQELNDLQSKMNQDGFWNDIDEANKVSQKVKQLENRINNFEKLMAKAEDVLTLIELAIEEQDEALMEEIEKEISSVNKSVSNLQLEMMFKGENDACNAILSLHAGAGGTEAQDWVSMLYRMYRRYCDMQGFAVKVLDYLDGEEAGIKSVTFEVDGENAYGYLKSEAGVHRLVRMSPFDSSGRRHTSFASLDVSPIIEGDENEIEIRPDEIRVDTYRSSGAGGQHVNTTDSAIRITHLPTGFVVQCQNERSQIQNRETAMKMLKAKLAQKKEQDAQQALSEIKGDMKKIEWGSQIRSYVFQPYTLVKDHRTGYESGNIDAVMDGEIQPFIESYLSKL